MLVPARAAVRRQQFELLRKHLAHRHDMSHHEVARGAGRTARDDNVRERCDAAFVSNRGIQDGRVVIGEHEPRADPIEQRRRARSSPSTTVRIEPSTCFVTSCFGLSNSRSKTSRMAARSPDLAIAISLSVISALAATRPQSEMNSAAGEVWVAHAFAARPGRAITSPHESELSQSR